MNSAQSGEVLGELSASRNDSIGGFPDLASQNQDKLVPIESTHFADKDLVHTTCGSREHGPVGIGVLRSSERGLRSSDRLKPFGESPCREFRSCQRMVKREALAGQRIGGLAQCFVTEKPEDSIIDRHHTCLLDNRER